MRTAHLTLPALLLAVSSIPQTAWAVASAELYSTKANFYGRFDARVRFAAGDGVVSSFFLWKEGSEVAGTFWNELDLEKLGANCQLQTNAYYGNPAVVHKTIPANPGNLCSAYHDYRFEWTPTYIAWSVDGQEIRRETGATATAYSQNATQGMTFHFNIWPGDATFGGNFDPAILPVYQYISWVQYSSYDGSAFKLEWREDFDGNSLPSGWQAGDWASPKNKSTHNTKNVCFVNGIAVLSLTADGAASCPSTVPADGAAGTGGAAAGGAAAGGANAGGANAGGANAGGANAGGANAGGANAGGANAGGANAGGANAGGRATGGISAGGAATGGLAMGGSSVGGRPSGGTTSGQPTGGASGGNTTQVGGNTTQVGGNTTQVGGNTTQVGGNTTQAGGNTAQVGGNGAGGVTSAGGKNNGDATGGISTSVGGATGGNSPQGSGAASVTGSPENGCSCRVPTEGNRVGGQKLFGLLAVLLLALRRIPVRARRFPQGPGHTA